MPQSLANIIVHLVFSTKDRLPLITPAIESELFPYLAAILNAHLSSPILIDGAADHVHLAFRLARTVSLSKTVEEVKKSSSGWIKTKGPEFARFYWQNGYGAFSVGQSGLDAVLNYIRNQKQHHHRVSFQEEFRILLTEHHVEWDERYVWD